MRNVTVIVYPAPESRKGKWMVAWWRPGGQVWSMDYESRESAEMAAGLVVKRYEKLPDVPRPEEDPDETDFNIRFMLFLRT